MAVTRELGKSVPERFLGSNGPGHQAIAKLAQLKDKELQAVVVEHVENQIDDGEKVTRAEMLETIARLKAAKAEAEKAQDESFSLKAAMEQMASDLAHALIVRPKSAEAGQYEVISGHHRLLAAERIGLPEVPCWVREMSDDDAYMQLVLCNTQSELHPLEEGKHAAESGMDLKAYAEASMKATTHWILA
jgi:hypothetical protein